MGVLPPVKLNLEGKMKTTDNVSPNELRTLAHDFQHIREVHHENTADAVRRRLE